MKYFAVGGLFLLLGFPIGAIVGGSFFAPTEFIGSDGTPIPPCGLMVLPSMVFGGMIGAASGLSIGLLLAWVLPTPSSPKRMEP